MEQNSAYTEMDDNGCRLLIEAVVRRAADDYLAAAAKLPRGCGKRLPSSARIISEASPARTENRCWR